MAATSTQQGTSGNPFGDYLQFVSNALRSRNNAGFASSSPWPDDGLHFVPDTDPVSAAYGPHGGSSYAATSTGASTSDPGFNLLWPASADSPVGGATYSQGASSYVNNPGPLSSAQWPDDGLGFVTDASNGLGLIRDNAPPSISISISGTGPIANAPAGAGISGDSAFNRLTPADWGAASSATTVPQNSDQLGAQNYQGQQAAAAWLASAFPNPYYQSGNPSVAGGLTAGQLVPQMSQWNPTLGDDVRQVWDDIRMSQPVESVLGRTPDETAQMWEPRATGLLPNTDKALQDWQVVGSYSPADLLPAPQTVGQGITTAFLRQINLNNLLMATGAGEVLKMLSLAKDAPRAVAITKASLGAYAASNGAQAVGQAAGDIAGNPNLPPGQKGAYLGNIGLGGLNMLGGVYPTVKPGLFARPDVADPTRFSFGRDDLLGEGQATPPALDDQGVNRTEPVTSQNPIGVDKLARPVGELREAGLKDAHHVIQDAAVRDLPNYESQQAPGVQLFGPSTAIGSNHYVATQIQRQAGGGSLGAERRIGYKALRKAAFSPGEARSAIETADKYFNSIGASSATPTRIPGNRK